MSSIPDALFGSNELRTSYTSISVNSTFIVLDRSGKSSMDGELLRCLSESELAVKESKCIVEGIDLDLVIFLI